MPTRLSLLVLVLAAGMTGAPGHGRSESRPSSTATDSHFVIRIADVDYVKGVYYFLYDPNLDALQIEIYDVILYVDDFNSTNDHSSLPGRAFMDKGHTAGENGTYGEPTTDPTDTASVRGMFTVLYMGDDYEVLDMDSSRFKVIKLNRQLTGDQRLAVTYLARRVLANGLGPTFRVGGMDNVDTDGVTRRYLKLLRPPASLVKPDPATGVFTRDSVFALTRDLELKNFYQLPGQRFDPSTARLTIRRGVEDPPVTSIPGTSGEAVPYVEVLGLDSYNQGGGQKVSGHDGVPDEGFIDHANGILFFPDPRPFAPRIGSAYRLPNGDPEFPFDQGVSNLLLRRDSLVGPPDASNGATRTYRRHA